MLGTACDLIATRRTVVSTRAGGRSHHRATYGVPCGAALGSGPVRTLGTWPWGLFGCGHAGRGEESAPLPGLRCVFPALTASAGLIAGMLAIN